MHREKAREQKRVEKRGKNNNKKGGYRSGAGRPIGSTMNPLFRRERMIIRLPAWLIVKLESMDGVPSRNIEKAILKFYNLNKK